MTQWPVKCFFAIAALVFSSALALAQTIQWASEVAFQYNQYSDNEYTAAQALGPPDAEPYGVMSKKAFRLNAESSYGTMSLIYANPQQVRQVTVIENFMPGRVSKVVLYDLTGKSYEVYNSQGQRIASTYNVLRITFDKTPYRVQKVAVHLSTYTNKGWAQIDAVGISEEVFDEAILPAPKVVSAKANDGIVILAEKERLSDNVNTGFIESKPIISPDGKSLYFARKNSPSNIGGKRDDQDIYVSQWIGGKWSLARNLGRPLNDKLPNGICSVSPDGNTITVINAYYENGRVEKGVSISRKTVGGWSFPVRQEIEDYENLSDYQDYFVSNSGKVLISAVERTDTYGDQDLYVSFRTGQNTWSKPLHMGRIINTPLVEFSPFLASDNKTLYFASNGHGGFGQSDIYYTRRQDETWTNWSKPTNIGKSVNTSAWDGYYAISARGDYAYFISTNNAGVAGIGGENGDIYRISLVEEIQPDPVVLVRGTVINSKTREPVEAAIYYESMPANTESGLANSDPVDGSYKIVLPIGNKYGFRAEAEGYIAVSRNDDFSNITVYMEIERVLELTPIRVGETVQLHNIFFVQSKAEIMPESEPELERLLKLMNDNPTLKIELGGHTDNRGSSSANVKLSQDRALAIANYLIGNGIDKRRLEYKGYGGTRPIASNASEASRQKNRRVEIKVLKF
jgi:outer membrane protein OmpA-like peptidoglycan-associated protein